MGVKSYETQRHEALTPWTRRFRGYNTAFGADRIELSSSSTFGLPPDNGDPIKSVFHSTSDIYTPRGTSRRPYLARAYMYLVFVPSLDPVGYREIS